MARGGARNRSGPPADPSSERSERRGIKLSALPAEGYRGPVPEFPLPDETVRESERWAAAWRTPQACAWALLSESWRLYAVAMWVRVSVRCEDAEASASLLGQLHRFADQIGMTPAGLAENGWAIARDEVSERAAEKDEPRVDKPKPERRLRAVSGGSS